MINRKGVKFFSTHGRINRKSFAKVYISELFFNLSCAYLTYYSGNLQLMFAALGLSYLIYIITIPLNIRRLHDSNLSGFFLIVGLVPVIINIVSTNNIISGFLGGIFGLLDLYLTFRKSTEGKNKYGDNQNQEYSEIKINLFCVGVIIMGIIIICIA